MPRALIVDDSRYQRRLIIQALGERFTAEEAANGKEAIERFAAALADGNPFDLVVMDILMPVLSGHEGLAGIRRLEDAAGVGEERRVPAVMLSSLDDPSNMLRAQFESGAQAYVTKPFAPNTLIETLASLGLVDNPLGDLDETEPEGRHQCKAF